MAVDNLYRLVLPRPVADHISAQRGHDELSRSFDAVTIFMSEMSNFMEACQDLTSHHAAMLLDEFSVLFDTTMAKYKLFKFDDVDVNFYVASGTRVRDRMFVSTCT